MDLSPGAKSSAVSMARGNMLANKASAPASSPVIANRSPSALTWPTPSAVSPVHPLIPPQIPDTLHSASPWRTRTRRVVVDRRVGAMVRMPSGGAVVPAIRRGRRRARGPGPGR